MRTKYLEVRKFLILVILIIGGGCVKAHTAAEIGALEPIYDKTLNQKRLPLMVCTMTELKKRSSSLAIFAVRQPENEKIWRIDLGYTRVSDIQISFQKQSENTTQVQLRAAGSPLFGGPVGAGWIIDSIDACK